jgi:hypothetical protein
MLDCARLRALGADVPSKLLQAVVAGQAATLDFSGGEAGQQEERALIRSVLVRDIRRYAELAERETGVHALWLGYPLLYARSPVEGEEAEVLAPLFLWPVNVTADLRHEGRVKVAPASDDADPRFNLTLAAWLRRQFKIEAAGPTQEELEELKWEDVSAWAGKLAAQFTPPAKVSPGGELEAVPVPGTLDALGGPAVVNAAALGYFTWQNEAVLADLEAIKSRAAECSGVVTGFAFGELPAKPPRMQAPSEYDRWVVCDADFSQMQVIWQARVEPGLVVHGPPGTGKSQTIVNVIADALGHGKTVLMVSQKRAATRVVLDRLKAAGLAELCVEAHDVETDRAAIFKSIRGQVDTLATSTTDIDDRKRFEVAEQITFIEEELDKYAKALHTPHEKIGLAHREVQAMMGRLAREFPAVREMHRMLDVLRAMSAPEVEKLCERVEALGNQYRQADPRGNPWRMRKESVQVTPTLREDVRGLCARLREADAAHMEKVRRYGAGLPLPQNAMEYSIKSAETIRWYRKLQSLPGTSPGRLARAWARKMRFGGEAAVKTDGERCRQVTILAQQVRETQPVPDWEVATDAMSEDQLQAMWKSIDQWRSMAGKTWRFVNPAWVAGELTVRKYARAAKERPLADEAEAFQGHLAAMIARRRLAKECANLVPDVIPRSKDDPSLLQFVSVGVAAFENGSWIVRQEEHAAWLKPVVDAFLRSDDAAEVEPLMLQLEASVQRVQPALKLVELIKDVEGHLAPDAVKELREKVLKGESLGDWIDSFDKGLSGLPALVALDEDRRARQGADKKVLEALEDYEDDRARGEKLPEPPATLPEEAYGRWWVALVRYSAACAWQRQIEKDSPDLTRLTPATRETKAKRLAELLIEKRNQEAHAVHGRWRRVQRDHRDEPWKCIFQLRRSEKGQAKRLREAVEAGLPHGLLKMRPCWLVNPAVAAQIFPLTQNLFDYVIFDEASQCPLEQAVPAIYRGQTVIVSGDERQLPPTSFFATRVEEGPDAAREEEETASETPVMLKGPDLTKLGEDHLVECEDLLTAAVGVLPEYWLCVHYRSEHPDLIRFSNHAFYDGRLEAPPVPRPARERPIAYESVGGSYRRRTNEAEAAALVRMLETLWKQEGDAPSLGVVTFNQPQRELIEDSILEKCSQDESFAARYQKELERRNGNQEMGFFVKNLENVQGDERDVMVFSTTFGPDEQGRFARRFGPVGAVGGERRLNVAVTRARKRVVVLGSMPLNEVAAALRSAEGAEEGFTPAGYLQLYLAYAQAVSEGDEERAGAIMGRLHRAAAPESRPSASAGALQQDILSVVRELGYRADLGVGDGGFRIDVAVLHPTSSRGYILGIDCDGGAYYADRPARVREVWRPAVLRARGWTLHSIWSNRWWAFRQEEVDRLKAAIEKSKGG